MLIFEKLRRTRVFEKAAGSILAVPVGLPARMRPSGSSYVRESRGLSPTLICSPGDMSWQHGDGIGSLTVVKIHGRSLSGEVESAGLVSARRYHLPVCLLGIFVRSLLQLPDPAVPPDRDIPGAMVWCLPPWFRYVVYPEESGRCGW